MNTEHHKYAPKTEEELNYRLARLEQIGLSELRREWARVWGGAIYTQNKSHLRKRIAWRLKTLFAGRDLSPEAQAKAVELVDFTKLSFYSPMSTAEFSPPPVEVAKPIIRREYKGRILEVYPLEGGRFCFNGAIYTSLSAIARKVTGNNISGNRFFKI